MKPRALPSDKTNTPQPLPSDKSKTLVPSNTKGLIPAEHSERTEPSEDTEDKTLRCFSTMSHEGPRAHEHTSHAMSTRATRFKPNPVIFTITP